MNEIFEDPYENIGEADGYLFTRDYPNGLRAGVCAMTFGKGRICVGRCDDWEFGFDRAYCYDHVGSAIAALCAWDGEGEPLGWFRNPDTGRRRPEGDLREYVYP
jgi:hypothetical protein